VKIPAGTKIDNAGDEETDWTFPEGTVFLKHFSDPLDDDRPIETRVLIQGPETIVAGVTYRWNEDRSDAVMVKEREEMNIPVASVIGSGGPISFSHILPGPNDCVVCHTRDNCVLGLNVLQMNRSVRIDLVLDSSEASGYGSVARSPVASAIGSEANQLVDWSEKGMFTERYSEESVRTLKSLVPIEDDNPSNEDSIALRARSYLHSHCSFCHHPEGTQRTVFDARFLTPLKDSKMVREKARTGSRYKLLN